MKKQFSLRSLALSLIAISLLAIIVIITTTSSKAESPLATRLSGKILLQVEDSGQAWYVSPDNNNQRIYLGSPQQAFNLMRTLGLGISNNDLNRYLNDNDNKFPTRLSGKILLAVEQHGEAYYINPVNLRGYYLGRPLDAFNVMRELALGITNTDLGAIEVFEQEEIDSQQPTTPIEESITNISLTTNPVAPMTNFSHIISVSATITNPGNISIKERGLLYDFTVSPNTNLTPTLDKYNQKLISEISSPNNTYTINISNLTPGSYPFIRSYAITGDNQIIYGNIINITGSGSNSLPSSLISSPLPVYTLTYTAGANGTLSGSAVQNISKNSNGSAITAVANTGYHFVNWSDGSTQNPRTDTSITSNLSITANFAINTYTVTFKNWDGSFISSSSVNYGSSATPPADPTRDGYTFAGWNIAFNNITSDLTVTAQYTINSYTLTYTAGAGGSLTGSTTQIINYGSDGIAVTATPSDGYNFIKWSDGSIRNPRIDRNITDNVIITAEFEQGLIKNGDFEVSIETMDGSSGWNFIGRLLSDFLSGKDINSPSNFPSKSLDSHEGDNAIEFNGSPENMSGIITDNINSLTLASGTSYTLRFYAKKNISTELLAGVAFMESDSSIFWNFDNQEWKTSFNPIDDEGFFYPFLSSSSDDDYFEVIVPSIIGLDKEIDIIISVIGEGVLVDNLVFSKNDDGINLLNNPSFEDNWVEFPAYWRTYIEDSATSSIEIINDTENVYSGDYSLYFNGASYLELRQNINNGEVARILDLNFYAKSPSGSGLNIFIQSEDNRFYNFSTNLFQEAFTQTSIGLSSSFALESVPGIAIPEDIGYFRIKFSANGVYIDDISLIPQL